MTETILVLRSAQAPAGGYRGRLQCLDLRMWWSSFQWRFVTLVLGWATTLASASLAASLPWSVKLRMMWPHGLRAAFFRWLEWSPPQLCCWACASKVEGFFAWHPSEQIHTSKLLPASQRWHATVQKTSPWRKEERKMHRPQNRPSARKENWQKWQRRIFKQYYRDLALARSSWTEFKSHTTWYHFLQVLIKNNVRVAFAFQVSCQRDPKSGNHCFEWAATWPLLTTLIGSYYILLRVTQRLDGDAIKKHHESESPLSQPQNLRVWPIC